MRRLRDMDPEEFDRWARAWGATAPVDVPDSWSSALMSIRALPEIVLPPRRWGL